MERQRLQEWEDSRKDELKSHRVREQEKVLTLKARQEHLTTDLDTLRDKVKVTGIYISTKIQLFCYDLKILETFLK